MDPGAITGGLPAAGAMPSPLAAAEPAVDQGPRLADDAAAIDRILDAADRHYKDEQERSERLVNEYRYGYHEGADNKNVTPKSGKDSSNDRVQANLTFAHINIQRAELYTYEPGIQVDPEDIAGATEKSFEVLVQLGIYDSIDHARRDFADALEAELEHSFQRGKTQEENEAAVFDAQARGMGVTKESFDPGRGLDRSDRLWRHEVYFDPHARNSIRQCQYVVQTCIDPIWKARDFFAAKGVTGIEPNHSMAEGEGLQAAAMEGDGSSAEKDCYKYFEIWINDGGRRTLIYKEGITKRELTRGPWPFQLEVDDFPYSLCVFNRQYVNLQDAFSELEVIATLRRAYDRLVRFLDEQTHRSIAKKILVDAQQDPEVIEKLKTGKTMEVVAVKTLGKALDSFVQVLDLNTPNDATMETAQFIKQLADEITGLDEIIRGASSRTDVTATEADIRENNAQRRSAVRAIELDRFLISQLQHRSQIARQLVQPDKIALIAGQKAAMLWSLHAADAEDFVCSYSVTVASGSTGQRARREKLNQLERLRQAGHEENQARISIGLPPAVDTLTIMLEAARADNNRNVDRFLLPGAQQSVPTPPAFPPGMAPPPGAPGAPGGPPAPAGPFPPAGRGNPPGPAGPGGAPPALGAPAATPAGPTGVPQMGGPPR